MNIGNECFVYSYSKEISCVKQRTSTYQGVRNVRGFFEKFDVIFSCYLRFEIRLFALLPTKYSYCQFIILFNYINDADNNTLYACNRNIENIMKDLSQNRSSHQRCSSKFRKIHRKTLAQESLFNKVAGLRPATLFKKETLAQVFSCEFCEILKNTFFDRTSLVAASEFVSIFMLFTGFYNITKLQMPLTKTLQSSFVLHVWQRMQQVFLCKRNPVYKSFQNQQRKFLQRYKQLKTNISGDNRRVKNM